MGHICKIKQLFWTVRNSFFHKIYHIRNFQAGHALNQQSRATSGLGASTTSSNTYRFQCPSCMGKFTKDQLLLHMPSCKDLIQTADAQTGHAQTGHAQTVHAQTVHAQTVHAQTSNAQTGHTQPTLVSQEPVRSVDPNTSQTPAIPSTSYQGIL